MKKNKNELSAQAETEKSPIVPDNSAPASVKDDAKATEPISVTIPGAKRATGLGTTTLYSLINDGKLESFCIGRRRLITWASLKRLANQGGNDHAA